MHHKVVRSNFIVVDERSPRLNRHAVTAKREGSAATLALARAALKDAIASARLESVPMDAKFIVGAVREATKPFRERRAERKASDNG